MEIGPLHNKIPILNNMKKSESNELGNQTGLNKQEDSVTISNESRQKLAELADKALMAEHEAKQIKLDSIKNKISSGFYNNDEVKGIIADKIIKDLE